VSEALIGQATAMVVAAALQLNAHGLGRRLDRCWGRHRQRDESSRLHRPHRR